MTHQCAFKKSRRCIWVKAVLAFKLFKEYLQDHNSESKRSSTSEKLLLLAFRKHQNGVVRKYCRQKQHWGTYIKEEFQDSFTGRIWQFHNKKLIQENSTGRSLLCQWCKCLSKSMKSLPFSSEDNSICMKIPEMAELPVSDNKSGSLRTTTCNKVEPDIACRVRQLRNKILHTTTMELDSAGFESFAGIMISILENIPDLAKGNKWQHVAEKIAQLKENDLIITNDDEVAAYKMVWESLDKRANEIQEMIDDICDTGEFFQCLPRRLNGNDKLQMLKCTVAKLIKNSCRLVDEHPRIKEDISAIRQDLQQIEKELETLLNVKNRQRRELGILTKKEKGAVRSSVPKYLKYASKTVRVTSFNECGDIVIPPDSLADSGFFYVGFGDCVRCFQCDIGLRHWSEEDDPWIEHSRWSKDCAFVRQMRGQEFVNLVQMAAQYSQNQNANEETPGDSTTGPNQEAPASGDIENLMHTDAAQSVLEMGYHPNIILRAIQAIREINDHGDLTAIGLMEKILELENADNSANSIEQMEPLQQNLTSQSTQARTHSGGPEMTRAQNHVDPFTDSSVRRISGMLSTGVEKIELSQLTCELIRENQYLRYQTYCINCRVVLRDVLFLRCPYPHLVFCHNCFMYFNRCPICDTTVKALMNVER